ncbi:MAG: SAF domain-containing protein [Anaerolineaceae bacterium]|nr:SAF domain-containing protein [Anaerolineaceae bacterium]
MEKRRSPWIPIALAVVIGIMVIALLNGVIRPVSMVVAKAPIAPGTLLTASLVEVHTVPAQARPSGAFERVEDLIGKVIVVGRAPGDPIVPAALGTTSQAGIPANLPADHLAVAVNVTMASGIAGLLREGQTVTVIGMLSPDVLQNLAPEAVPVSLPYTATTVAVEPGKPMPTPTASPTPAPPHAPLARIALSGLKILMVPQSFRYEEQPAGSTQEQLFASARTVQSAQEGSVVVLDVPVKSVELVPGMPVNPATLLVALNRYGSLYLTLEPASGFKAPDILTLNLADLYNALNDHREGK